MLIQHTGDRRWMMTILLITVLSGCASVTAGPITTPAAIFIIVDGIPADVLENTATPVLDSIAGKDGYTRAYVGGEVGGVTQSPTSSAIGYNNLLTGTWANKHNVYDNQVGDPNYAYWDIFRIAKEHDPTLHTAIFSTWTDNRTKLIGDGLEKAGGNKLDYAFDGFELDTERFPHDLLANYIRAIDDLVTDEAARYVESDGPDLSWVYLEYTDSVGHVRRRARLLLGGPHRGLPDAQVQQGQAQGREGNAGAVCWPQLVMPILHPIYTPPPPQSPAS